MVVLISGDSHTGKTLSAQKLLEKYKYPFDDIKKCANVIENRLDD